MDEDELVICVPADKVNAENMKNLLSSKGFLIKKAIGVEELPVEFGENEVIFQILRKMSDYEEEKAYTDLIKAMCKYSKERERILGKERPVENEKYAFRCFLMRLGFIGPETKKDRHILLQNLSGSAAFRGGVPNDNAES